ncbi:hypothetical protein ACF0H5_018829 [Mactra antiquata]
MMWISYAILFLGLFTKCVTQTIDDARALTSSLLANYSRILKPKLNQTEPVQVSIGLQLLNILEFDEIHEKLSIICVTYLFWKDELLTWTPEDYGGLQTVEFESHQVWTPMFVLVNTVQDIKKFGFGDDWLYVNYDNYGSAKFYPGGVLSARCDVDVTYFPLDSHKCNLQISTWDASNNYMNITPMSEELLLKYYAPNGKWNLIYTAVVPVKEHNVFNTYLTLARKPRFVIVNVILPVVFMALISTIVFFIPVESGERVSYSITMLLAIGVFLTLVGDNLPKTSNPMAIFSYYLLSMLILNILITVINIVSVKCFYKSEEQPVDYCLGRFIKCFLFKKGCAKQEQYGQNRDKDASLESISCTTDPKQKQNITAQFTINSTTKVSLCGNEKSMAEKCDLEVSKEPVMVNNNTDTVDDLDDKENGVSWHDVSTAIDKISLIVSIVLILILTIVFFLIIWIGGTKRT